MNSLQLAPGNLEIARLFGSACQHNRIEVAAQIIHGNVLSYLSVGDKLHTFGGHLIEAAVDDVFFKFELGNAVAEQSADAVGFFIDGDGVPCAAKLLCGGKSGGSGADDCDFLPAAKLWRFGPNPAFQECALDDILFDSA